MEIRTPTAHTIQLDTEGPYTMHQEFSTYIDEVILYASTLRYTRAYTHSLSLSLSLSLFLSLSLSRP